MTLPFESTQALVAALAVSNFGLLSDNPSVWGIGVKGAAAEFNLDLLLVVTLLTYRSNFFL